MWSDVYPYVCEVCFGLHAAIHDWRFRSNRLNGLGVGITDIGRFTCAAGWGFESVSDSEGFSITVISNATTYYPQPVSSSMPQTATAIIARQFFYLFEEWSNGLIKRELGDTRAFPYKE